MGQCHRTVLLMLLAIAGLNEPAIAADAVDTAVERSLAGAKRMLADGFPEYRDQVYGLINDAIRLAPRSPEAYATLGRFLLWEVAAGFRPKSDLVLAVELGDQVKALAPDRPLGDYLKCESLLTLAQTKTAEATCQAAQKAFPAHIDTELFRARFLSESEPKVAIESAQRALALGANYDELSYVTSNALIRLSGERSAGETLQRFAAIYPNRWIWQRAGAAFAAEGHPQEAKQAFLAAIALGNDVEAHLSLGGLAQTQLQDAPLAEHEYRTLLKILETKPELEMSLQSNVLARLSVLYLATNRTAEATEAASKALLADIDNRPLIQAIGETFDEKNRLTQLESPLRAVVKGNPEFRYGHVALARIAKERKVYSEAVRDFTKALALQPGDDVVVAARGHTFYEMKLFPEALEDFVQATNLKPQEASHHYNRSCMLSLLGRTRESYESLRMAILLDQSLAQLARTDADLVNLRENIEIKPFLATMGVTTPPTEEPEKKSAQTER